VQLLVRYVVRVDLNHSRLLIGNRRCLSSSRMERPFAKPGAQTAEEPVERDDSLDPFRVKGGSK